MKFLSNVVARFRADANSYVFCAVVSTLLGTIFLFFMSQGHHSRLAHIGVGALAGLIGSLSALGRDRYINSLARRSNENRPLEWDVTINSVTVGTISDSDYAAVRYYVFRDNRIWLAQLFAGVKNFWNLTKQTVLALPTALVLGAIALALFAPNEIISICTSMAHASPDELSAAVSGAVWMWMTLLVVGVALRMSFSGRVFNLSLTSQFDEAIALAVRRRLGVAAEGDVWLSRVQDGRDMIFYEDDRWAFARVKS
ncbi:hypothetical protein [Burkholderia vietnamiensis]|uniref:hypothetical protein n=1 Tax=Burkholderia vietnamiensis TaxID=60552 RepID=UPI00158F1B7C|nr:hypothetical protein [Burkholderia vietnamiensis]